MVKRVIKKKFVKKKSIIKKSIQGNNVEKVLVENFVSLQKVMTNLSLSFNELSGNISKLLELFEVSANAMAKKEINFTKPMDETKIMHKLDTILDQNKTIARGLSLMHERSGIESPKQIPAPVQAPIMKAPTPMPKKPLPAKTAEYQKSPFSKGF